MTLRRKTQMALGVTLLVLLLLLDITFTDFLRRSAEQTDRERMTLNLSRAVVSINGAAQTLSAIAGNWANSDTTWDYMRDKNPNYETTTLNRDVLTDIGISSMIFIGNDHKVKLFKDFSTEEEPSSPASEFCAIFGNKQNYNLLDEAMTTGGTSGIVLKGDQPVLFSIKPILTSDMRGPSAGSLIVTRTISPSLVESISRNLHFNFAIEPTTEEEKKTTETIPLTFIDTGKRKDTVMTGKMLVKDHAGIPSFWVIGVAQKEDTSAAERKIQQLFLMFAGLALVLCLLYDLMVKHIFSNRMRRLQKEIETIRDENEHKGVITIDSKNDEISSLQRTISDIVAFHDYTQERKDNLDNISLMVYERFVQAGNRLCYKTIEDIATAFSPGDEKFRRAIPRAAKMTEYFCKKMNMCEEEAFYAYLGSLFSRIGLLGIPFTIRNKNTELTQLEQREYKKYPIISKDFLESVELLRPAAQVPFYWKENWDGTGFPNGISGSAIPLSARIFAVVDEWNEMTRMWLGRKLPKNEEIEERLRSLAGSRLDPKLVEQFIKMLNESQKY